MDDLTRAAVIEARARLQLVLGRVLPRAGVRIGPELLTRLAADLQKEGCVIRHPEAARARANERAKRAGRC